MENNENVIQQVDNNNYISDDEDDGNNQPTDFDAQTEYESDTKEEKVNEVIA